MKNADDKIMNIECRLEIGVEGDGSCPKLASYIHCRNCPVFAEFGRELLTRRPPDDYAHQWTQIYAKRKEDTKSQRLSSVIIFRIADQRMAMPVKIVKDVRSDVPVRRIPHRSNDRLRGLVNIQGVLRLCVSIHAFMGLSPDRDESSVNHMIMIEKGTQNWVFAVDELQGLHHIDLDEMQNTPVQAAKALDPITKGLFHWQGEAIGVVDEDAIFSIFARSLR
jgi:chemotaxis-related protein WspD